MPCNLLWLPLSRQMAYKTSLMPLAPLTSLKHINAATAQSIIDAASDPKEVRYYKGAGHRLDDNALTDRVGFIREALGIN